jgi:hypothetical protein
VTPYTGTIVVLDPPVVSGVTVVPAAAPAGTLRTITVNATDPNGDPLTYTMLVNGTAATQTSTPGVFTITA